MMKKNMNLPDSFGSMWLASSLLALLLLLGFPSFSFSQSTEIVTGQETTPNQLPAMSEFSRDGITSLGTGNGCSTGEYCTGGGQQGGTFGATFNLQQNMTIASINRGFEFDSAVDVKSHPSNVVVPICSTTLQASPDCRDIFSLTIKLYNSSLIGSNLVHQFVHEVELDFSGMRSYSFNDVVPENSYTALTGEYLLFGIDAGYPSGMFGPSFSSPSVTTTFDIVTLIETEILDIISDIIETNIPIGETVTNMAIEVSTPSGDLVTTMEMEIETPMEISSVIPPPTLAPPPTEAQMEETNIEEEIQDSVEPEPEPEPASEPEPEPSESADATPAPAVAATPRQRERAAEPRRQTRRQKVKAAAQKIVKKIAPSERYSAASQTTTMVVMNLISARIVTDLVIKDRAAATFFVASTVPDGPSMVDPMTNYRLFGQANGAHSALVESQWSR
jgi:hypothetical protein